MMKSRFSFLYGFRIFRSSSLTERSNILGAVVSIAFSLVPLITVICVSSSMISGITKRLVTLSSSEIMVTFPKKRFTSISSFTQAAEKLSSINNVEYVMSEVQGMALACGNDYRTGVMVRGVDKDLFRINENFSSLFKTVEGNIEDFESGKCILGQYCASLLGLSAGDMVSFVSMDLVNKSKTAVPKVFRARIAAIVSCGYQELDAMWAFVPIEDGYKGIAPSARTFVSGIISSGTFGKNTDSLYEEVCKLLYEEPDFKGASVSSWQEQGSAQFENFASTRAMLLIIMSLIVIVASVNISSAIVMTVFERKKEMAILLSMGASPFSLCQSFTFLGLLCGTSGVVIGIPLGLIVSINFSNIISFFERILNFFASCYFTITSSQGRYIYILDPAFYLQKVEVTVPWFQVAVTGILTILISLLISIVSSARLSSEKPVDTLRKI